MKFMKLNKCSLIKVFLIMILGAINININADPTALEIAYHSEQILITAVDMAKRHNSPATLITLCKQIAPDLLTVPMAKAKEIISLMPSAKRIEYIGKLTIADKETILEGLSNNFMDPKNQDSLCTHIDIFTLLCEKGVSKPEFKNLIAEFKKHRKCRKDYELITVMKKLADQQKKSSNVDFKKVLEILKLRTELNIKKFGKK